jgi:DNA polymerase-3 subunit alpha
VREGWINRETQKKGEPRLQYNNFQLLHDVMDSYAKKLSIQLNIKDIQTDKITSLRDLVKMHPGNQSLHFVVYDHEESLKLHMPSRKKKVKISQELLQELENEDIYYKLN